MKAQASMLSLLALAMAFMLIVWSGLVILRQTHYLGETGISLSWIGLGLGVAIVLVRFDFARVLRPPLVYFYAGFFVLMFARTMGWLP